MLPILALSPLRMGASATVASAVVVAYSVGRIAGSGIGGGIVARRGAVRCAAMGLVAMVITALGCGASTTLLPFFGSATAFGIAHSVFHVARQAQVVGTVAHAARARGLTTLAGMWRAGNFIGPVVGSIVIHVQGLRWAYALAAVTIALAAAALVAADGWRESKHHVRTEHTAHIAVIREHGRVFATLGVALALTVAARAARVVAIPLWAEHLGLSDGAGSALFAVSAAVDMVLFYPAGSVSDRWGRRWSGVPSAALLTLGFLALPFVTGVVTLTVVAMILGAGNGWGSGLVMTLGADVSPRRSRSVFLGLWTMLSDVGALAGPAIISLGALVSLSTGVVGVGIVSLASTFMLRAWIPPEHDRER